MPAREVFAASNKVDTVSSCDDVRLGVVLYPIRIHPHVLISNDSSAFTSKNPFRTLSLGTAALDERLSVFLLRLREDWQQQNQRKKQHDVLKYATEGRAKIGRVMDRKARRTIIDISQDQPGLDFDEAELSPPFSFPEYQRQLL